MEPTRQGCPPLPGCHVLTGSAAEQPQCSSRRAGVGSAGWSVAPKSFLRTLCRRFVEGCPGETPSGSSFGWILRGRLLVSCTGWISSKFCWSGARPAFARAVSPSHAYDKVWTGVSPGGCVCMCGARGFSLGGCLQPAWGPLPEWGCLPGGSSWGIYFSPGSMVGGPLSISAFAWGRCSLGARPPPWRAFSLGLYSLLGGPTLWGVLSNPPGALPWGPSLSPGGGGS